MSDSGGSGTPTYLDRLAARSVATRTVLCLGVDPDPNALPPGFASSLAGVERFAGLLLEAAAPYAAAIKPNLAFFEAFGSAGLAAFERLRASLPPEVLVVVDAKRGDIGTTSARHAAALFDHLGADAVTVSPYLGEEAILPLLERLDRFAYVLCRTSNPGAGELQGLDVAADPEIAAPAEPLWARVARRAGGWGPGGTVGLVVGATAPQEMAAVRGIAPGLAMLVPGIGAQGGSLKAVLKAGPARALPAGGRPGGGLLINVSRAIVTDAVRGRDRKPSDDLGDRLRKAARSWASRLPVLPLPPAGRAGSPRLER